MKQLLVASLLLLGASTAAGQPNGTCSVWRMPEGWVLTYSETSGDCGAELGSLGLLTYSSDDPCRRNASFSLPTDDGLGTQAWTVAETKVSETRVEGTATVQVTHPDAPCTNTYTYAATKP